MLSRISLPLIATAVLVFACGPGKPSPLSLRPKSGPGKGVLTRVSVDTTQGTLRFAIVVENDTRKRVELDFPDGQTHDFAVLDDTGQEIWRWSTGRMFTQSMQNRLLDANDSVRYSEPWSAPHAGRYTLVAELHSENYPVTQRVAFSLPGTLALQ